MKKWLAKALHNCIAHPLLMILPSKLSHPIHDKTAEWAFGTIELDFSIRGNEEQVRSELVKKAGLITTTQAELNALAEEAEAAGVVVNAGK